MIFLTSLLLNRMLEDTDHGTRHIFDMDAVLRYISRSPGPGVTRRFDER